jgi:hypothetical protein
LRITSPTKKNDKDLDIETRAGLIVYAFYTEIHRLAAICCQLLIVANPLARNGLEVEHECIPGILRPPQRGPEDRESGHLSIEMPGVDGATQLVG